MPALINTITATGKYTRRWYSGHGVFTVDADNWAGVSVSLKWRRLELADADTADIAFGAGTQTLTANGTGQFFAPDGLLVVDVTNPNGHDVSIRYGRV